MRTMIKTAFSLLPFCVLLCGLFSQDNDAAGNVTIGVMQFTTVSDKGLDFLGESFAASIADKLVRLKGVKVYERNQFEKIAGELQLAGTGIVDEATVQHVGKIVSIDYMVVGAVTQLADSVKVSLNLTSVNTGRSVISRELQGKYQDIFDLQDAISMLIIDALELNMSELDRERIFKKEGQSVKAFELFNSALSQTDPHDRIAFLERAIAGESGFAQALHLLAESYYEIGDLEKCKGVYVRLLEDDPGDFKSLYNLALLDFEEGRLDTALEYFRECAGLKPSDPDVWYHIALLHEYDEEGVRGGPGADLRAACEYYEKALELNPNHLEANFAVGLLSIQRVPQAGSNEEIVELVSCAVARFHKYLEVFPQAFNRGEIEQNIIMLENYLEQIRTQ